MLGINGTLIIVLLSFLLFTWLLELILWSPVAGIKAKRDQRIDGDKQKALNKSQKSEELIAEINRKIAAFRAAQNEEAEKIVLEARSEFREVYETTNNEMQKDKEKSIAQIIASKEKCFAGINELSLPVAQEISERVRKEIA